MIAAESRGTPRPSLTLLSRKLQTTIKTIVFISNKNLDSTLQ